MDCQSAEMFVTEPCFKISLKNSELNFEIKDQNKQAKAKDSRSSFARD